MTNHISSRPVSRDDDGASSEARVDAENHEPEPSVPGSVVVEAQGLSRGAMLWRALAGLGAASAGGGVAAGLATGAGAPALSARDVAVLEFALTFEHLQAAFYADTLNAGKLSGEPRQFAQVVGAQEREHLTYLSQVVGRAAGTTPRFRFGDAVTDQTRFLTTAVSFGFAAILVVAALVTAVPVAAAGTRPSSAGGGNQLLRQFPLGSRRLCCTTRSGSSAAASRTGSSGSRAGELARAEVTWRRCLAHRDARAATNLGFLLEQRGDPHGARLAYSAAARWGDPEGRRLAAALTQCV
jgi:hypothetical protein